MKKILCASFMVYHAFLIPIQPKILSKTNVPSNSKITAFKPHIPTILIHNSGNKPFTFNSLSFLFSINGESKVITVPYKKAQAKRRIKPNATKKITGIKITLNYPESSQINYLGISKIMGDDINIAIANPNPVQDKFYVTNNDGSWKEDINVPALRAKTSTLKSAAVVIHNKKKKIVPQSKSAKAAQNIIKPKNNVPAPKVIHP